MNTSSKQGGGSKARFRKTAVVVVCPGTGDPVWEIPGKKGEEPTHRRTFAGHGAAKYPVGTKAASTLSLEAPAGESLE